MQKNKKTKNWRKPIQNRSTSQQTNQPISSRNSRNSKNSRTLDCSSLHRYLFLLQAQNTNKVMKRWPIPPVVYEGPTTVPLAPVLALLSPRTHLLVREGRPGVGNGEALQIRKRKIPYKQVQHIPPRTKPRMRRRINEALQCKVFMAYPPRAAEHASSLTTISSSSRVWR